MLKKSFSFSWLIYLLDLYYFLQSGAILQDCLEEQHIAANSQGDF